MGGMPAEVSDGPVAPFMPDIDGAAWGAGVSVMEDIEPAVEVVALPEGPIAGIDECEVAAPACAALVSGAPASAAAPRTVTAAIGIDASGAHRRLVEVPARARSGMTRISAAASSMPVVSSPTGSAVSQPFNR